MTSLRARLAAPQDARRAAQRALAVLAALVVGYGLLALTGPEPGAALVALLTGPLPRLEWADGAWHVHRLSRFGAALEDGTTLAFLGLAVALPFRARQFTLGADGALFLSALASVSIGLALPGPAIVVMPVAIAAALAVGAAWAMLPGWLRVRFGASEIVTSLMLNVVAVEFYRLAITDWLRDPHAGFLATPALPAAAAFASLVPHTNVSAMVLAVPFAAAAAALLLDRTTLGYEIRVLGDAPAFARRVGLPVERAIVLSMGVGGLYAALAGVHVGHALLRRLPVDLNPGLGFDGLVVALLARNEPRHVPLAALLYAWLRAGAMAMERDTGVPHELLLVIQAVTVLFVLADGLGPALLARLRRTAPRVPAGEAR
jgi:simple sugar transport system permease protein